MRHNKKGKKFGREADHRKAMLRNLVISLLTHGRIETTITKAKEMRSLAERVITYGKQGDLHNKRLAFSVLSNHKLVKKLFDEIAPKYTDRDGGYTRVLKTRMRRGDCAPMAIIELVEGEITKKEPSVQNITASELAKDVKPKEKIVKATETPTNEPEAVETEVITETETVTEEAVVNEPETVTEEVVVNEPETTASEPEVEEVKDDEEKPE